MSSTVRQRFGDFSVLRREASGHADVTVHFAHATGFNAETYVELACGLEPSIDLHMMDARGHGYSSAIADPKRLRSWKPFREDLEAYVDTLRQPVILVGHSMGATVSMEVAARRPDLVRGLVMIDPVIVPPRLVPVLAVARALGLSGRLLPIVKLAARRRMEFESRAAAVENFVGKGPFRTWETTWVEAYVRGGTVETEAGAVRLSCDRAWEAKAFAVSTVNPYRALRKVQCPITLCARVHAGPPFTEESREAFMRCRPNTRLLVLEGVTHFMAMERPDLVIEEIERMVQTVRSEFR